MKTARIHRIVAGVDFSDWTDSVLDMAAQIARAYDADLSVVHAETFLPPPYFTKGAISDIARVLGEQRQEADTYLRTLVGQRLGHHQWIDTRIVDSSPVEGLLQTADTVHADLLVLGTHGRRGINRFLMGSVAEHIVRETAVPVLTVRDRAGEERLPVRRILCPVNYTQVAHEALAYASDMAQRSGAELLLMNCQEDTDDEAADQERRLCDSVPSDVQKACSIRPVLRSGDAAEQIMKMVVEEKCDLVVIGAQHRPLIETTIFGTTSIRVMRHAPCPVLSVPRAAEREGQSPYQEPMASTRG